MSPLEWLRYRLHGVVWRVPVWLIVLLIIVIMILNVTIIFIQPWPHPIFNADINYNLEFDTYEQQWFVIVSGSVTNIGSSNGTCSIEIRMHDKRGYDYTEIMDLGLVSPGLEAYLSRRYFLPSEVNGNPIVNIGNIEVTYRLFY